MNTKELRLFIEQKKLDKKLIELYVDESLVGYQTERYLKALNEFEALYGTQEVGIYSAPGRSEVSGNHTDHQHGRVLAAAINLDAIAIASKQEGIIKVKSDNFDISPIDIFDTEKKDNEEGTSEGIIRGVVSRFKELGYQVGGFNAYMTSDVLIGAGLSSSAAFEVLVGTVLSYLYNSGEVSPVEIAKIGQYSENVYFGKPCGLMDQMASSVGGLVNIDFADTAKPVINPISVDFSSFNHSLCIVDTKGSHADLTPDYAAIPTEMKGVAAFFGKEVLNEVCEDDFYGHINELREKVGDRAVLRAYHLFNENHRVDAIVEALNSGNFEGFKQGIVESGRSSYQYLQNVYSNRFVQNQGVSIALALCEKELNGHGFVRVHGGGFAGTIQAFVENDVVSDFKTKIETYFGEGACHILQVRNLGGCEVVKC